MTESQRTCEYCGGVYYDEDEHIPGKEYMWQGHIIMECDGVPEEYRKEMSEPNLRENDD